MKRIVVFGATGKQGESVIRSLLTRDEYEIVGVSRRAETDKTRELKALAPKRVEFVAGDLSDPNENFDQALTGAYGVFLNTNFWDPSQAHKEVEITKRVADLALRKGVTHFIYSTLPNVQKVTNGRLVVPHCTDKALAEDYVRSLGFRFVSFVLATFYYQNFLEMGQKNPETGALDFVCPTTEAVRMLDVVKSIGPATELCFSNPETYNEKTIVVEGDRLTMEEAQSIFNSVSKEQKLNVVRIPYDSYRKLPFPHADELGDMFQFFDEYSLPGSNDPNYISSAEVLPDLPSFRAYVSSL